MNEAKMNREKQTEMLRECDCFERRTHECDDEGGSDDNISISINDENGIAVIVFAVWFRLYSYYY